MHLPFVPASHAQALLELAEPGLLLSTISVTGVTLQLWSSCRAGSSTASRALSSMPWDSTVLPPSAGSWEVTGTRSRGPASVKMVSGPDEQGAGWVLNRSGSCPDAGNLTWLRASCFQHTCSWWQKKGANCCQRHAKEAVKLGYLTPDRFRVESSAHGFFVPPACSQEGQLTALFVPADAACCFPV